MYSGYYIVRCVCKAGGVGDKMGHAPVCASGMQVRLCPCACFSLRYLFHVTGPTAWMGAEECIYTVPPVVKLLVLILHNAKGGRASVDQLHGGGSVIHRQDISPDFSIFAPPFHVYQQ
jgi:hypothetical protein